MITLMIWCDASRCPGSKYWCLRSQNTNRDDHDRDGGGHAAQAIVGNGPEGIEPGVELHIAGVAFADHEFERVVIRLRGFALLATEILRPGSKFAGIKCITGWPYLHHYRIQTHFLHLIQQLDKLLLLIVSAQS